MSGYTTVTNPRFVSAENFTCDEVVEYELHGFHYLTDRECRKLQCCDWLFNKGKDDDQFLQNEEDNQDGVDYLYKEEEDFSETLDEPFNTTMDDEPEDNGSEVKEIWRRKNVLKNYSYSASGSPSNSDTRRRKRGNKLIGRSHRTSCLEVECEMRLVAVEVNDRTYRVGR